MKAFHNSFTDEKIKNTDFDFNKLGENTWGNASNFIYAFTSLLGPWLSSKKLSAYDFAHKYDIEDSDFMTVEDNEELYDILAKKLSEYGIDENERLEREDLYMCRKIASKIRQEYINETYTGFWIKNDKEFGGESLIVFDLSKIN